MIVSSTGLIEWIPVEGVTSSGEVTISVADGGEDGAAAGTEIVTLAVTAVNDAPVVSDIASQSIAEGASFATINLDDYVNDIDNTDAEITWTASGNSDLTVSIDGSRVATIIVPDAEWNGTEALTFRATDPELLFAETSSATFSVTAVNDAPVAGDDTVIANEDTALVITGASLLANDTDIDGDTLGITALGQPIIDTDGAVVYNGDGTYTYTPGADFNGTDYIFYAVSDGKGGFDTATVTLIITPQNDAPTISGIPDTSIDEDSLYSFKPAADDIDRDPLAFSIINQPAWASFDPVTGMMSGIPTNADVGTTNGIVIAVTDGTDSASLAAFDLQVINVNDAPVAIDDAYSTDEDVPMIVAAPGVQGNNSDVDGDALTALLAGGPSNGSLVLSSDGAFTYIPNPNFNGTDSFSYQSNDGGLDSNLATVTITVATVNDAPTAITISGAGVVENQPSGTVVGTFATADADVSDSHTFTLVAGPGDTDNLSFQIAGDTLQTKEVFDFETQSSYSIRVRADDHNGGTYDKELIINIIDHEDITLAWEANDDPDLLGYRVYQSDISGVYDFEIENAIKVRIVEVEEDGEKDHAIFDYTPDASDSLIPAGIETLVISIAEPGPWYWVVVAFDSWGQASDPSYEVSNDNKTPTDISLSQLSINENINIGTLVGTFTTEDPDTGNSHIHNFAVGAGDDDNSKFTIEGDNLYTNESINYEVKDSYSILVRTDDQNGDYGEISTYQKAFTIAVNDVNDGPSISGAPTATVLEDTVYSFIPAAADEDLVHGDILTFSVVNLPAWASFDPATGAVSGTPSNADVGTTAGIEITVTDGEASASLAAFDLEVVNVNDAPVISGTPATAVLEDTAYSFTPVAADADIPYGDSLTFSVVNLPAWASFDPVTGAVSGTPSNADVGTITGIEIAVTDGEASASLAAFDLEVVNVNDAPVISGTPAAAVLEDTAYSFTPAAADSDQPYGDSLTFSVANQPSWADFDPATGALSGTPTNADVGTTSGIVITVTDGIASASLVEFNLEVVNVNDSPSISGIPANLVDEDIPYSFIPTVGDDDLVHGDVLTFSVVNQPAWADFDPATGVLSGTPANADVGTTSGIVITVSDGSVSASLAAFDLEVVNVNDAPRISGIPASLVDEDNPYSFIPMVGDDDLVYGDVLTFSVDNLPAWADFDLNTGVLSGTPTNADVGTTSGIVIAVTDGNASASLAAFDLEVINVNDAPVITAQYPLSIAEEAELTITPADLSVTDADNTYPAGFTLTVSDGVNYSRTGNAITPSADFIGTLTVPVSVDDGEGANSTSAVFNLSVTVTAVNDAPQIIAQYPLSTAEEAELTITPADLTVTDPDNTYPAGFTLTVADGANYSRTGNAITPSQDFNGSLTVPVSVDDGEGLNSTSAVFALSVTVTAVSDAPSISGTSVTTTLEDALYSFTPVVTDADIPYGDVLTFSIANPPAWAGFDTATGALSGTPTNADVGTTSGIVITVTDGSVNASLTAFDLQVVNVNDTPVITGQDPLSTAEEAELTITLADLTVADPDNTYPTGFTLAVGDGVNYSRTGNAITPSPDFNGTLTVPVSVDDGEGLNSTSAVFALSVTVTAVSDGPSISGTPVTTTLEDAPYSFTPVVTDADIPYGDVLTFSIANPPAWAGFDTATGALSGTPTNADVGTTSGIVITVTDGSVNASLAAFNLEVINVNDTPVITGQDPLSTAEEAELTITLADLSVTDPDNIYPEGFALTVADGANYSRTGNTITPSPDFNGSLTVLVSVDDGEGANGTSAVFDLSVTVTAANDAPSISGTPALTVLEDVAYSFTPVAADADIPYGDSLTFSIVNSPAWAAFDPATGTLSGTPTNADVGSTSGIVITVTDGNVNASLAAFNLEVINVNDTPVITGQDPLSTAEEAELTITLADLTVTDPDNIYPEGFALTVGDGVNYSRTGHAITPSQDFNGTLTVPVSVDDGEGANSTSAVFNLRLTVTGVNDGPSISGTPAVTTLEDAVYSFTPVVTDADIPYGDTLTFSIVNPPAWAAFDTATGRLSGTPTNADVGSTSGIVITVTDGSLSASLTAFDLSVANVNDTPVITAQNPLSTVEETELTIRLADLSVTDPDNTFPAGFTLAVGDGVNYSRTGDTITPSPDFNGTLTVPVSVDDGEGANGTSAVFDLSVTVTAVNDAPVITAQNPLSTAEEAELTIRLADLSVTDPDNSYPAGFSLAVGDGVNYSRMGNAITPSLDFNGTLTVPVSVDDGQGASGTSAVFDLNVTVTAVNDGPSISGTPAATILEDGPYSFIPFAADVDTPYGDSLTFSIANQPGWAEFDPATGALSGVPTNSDIGTTSGIVITVTDGSASASLAAFDLEVVNVNDGPSISGTPALTVLEDVAYSFTPVAADADIPYGDSLTFSIVNSPAWAAFDPATGTLSGTPTNADVGSTSGIVITVTDGNVNASLAAFNLEVINVNDTPVITGQDPLSTAEEAELTITPADLIVTDPDNTYPAGFTLTVGDGVNYSHTGNAITPSLDFNGTLTVPVSVDDGEAVSSTSAVFDLSVTVTGLNDAPVAVDDAYSTAEDVPLTVAAPGVLNNDSDVDGDALAARPVDGPSSGALVFSSDGALTYTPDANFNGTDSFSYHNNDGGLDSNIATVTITVAAVNDAPTAITITDAGVDENQPSGTVVGTFATTDTDISDSHTYTLVAGTGDTDNLSFQIAGDTLQTKEVFDFETQSSYSIRVRADDQNGGTYDQEFIISIFDHEELTLAWDANDEPELLGYRVYQSDISGVYDFEPENAIMVRIVEVEEAGANDYAIVDFSPDATDSLIPAGIETLFVSNAEPGPWYWVVVAIGSWGRAGDPSYEVSNVNRTPSDIGLSQQSLNENIPIDTLVGTFSTQDPDTGNSHIHTLASGAGDDDNSKFKIEGNNLYTNENFNYELKDSYSILIQTDDQNRDYGEISTYEKAFVIAVNDANDAPVITGTPAATVLEDTVYSFNPDAADDDLVHGDVLTFSVVNLPAWASFDPATGAVSGTPSNADVGTTTGIEITVTDGEASASLAAFDLAVVNVNDAPVISGTPATAVLEDTVYSFNPDAVDDDLIHGDALSFSVVNLPAWANFDPGTGAVSGTPSNADVGTTPGIEITVTDGEASETLAAFDLAVVNVNDAPVITAQNPLSTVEETELTITPADLSVTDPDNTYPEGFTLTVGDGVN